MHMRAATRTNVPVTAVKRSAVSWCDPGPPTPTGALACRTKGSNGVPVLLLHGLLGSSRFWGGDYDELAADGRLVVVDLLGFGLSPRPPGRYDADAHVDAILATLDDLGIGDAVVIGAHSFGAIVAAALAERAPARVAGIIMFGPPVYTSEGQARRRLAGLGGMARLFARDTAFAERVCRWMCAHRTLAATIAVIARPDLPAPIARDSVQHNWMSYSRSMRNIILGDTAHHVAVAVDALAITAPHGAKRIATPIVMIIGKKDRVPDPAVVRMLTEKHRGVRTERWDGGHDLPLRAPRRCISMIASMRQQVALAPLNDADR